MPLDFRELCGATARHKFKCGDAEIDKWWLRDAWKHHEARKHITTCARQTAQSDPVGFYTLSTVTEDIRDLPGVSIFSLGHNYFPCLQLVYLAVDAPYQNVGIGSAMIIRLTMQYADIGQAVGIPAMIVTPVNESAKRLYLRFGFESYPRHPRLFMPLRSAVEARDAALAEAEKLQEPNK